MGKGWGAAFGTGDAHALPSDPVDVSDMTDGTVGVTRCAAIELTGGALVDITDTTGAGAGND